MSLAITSGDGKVRIDCSLQGRIFAELQGKLIHRFNENLAKNPSPVEFNNIGGNSLWPGPEGGPLAYNYLTGDWLVQPGVNTACPHEETASDGYPESVKTVMLSNRAGTKVETTFRRRITPVDVSSDAAEFHVAAVAYEEKDSLSFTTPQDPAKAVIAAWSLEQFAGCGGITAFGIAGEGTPKEMINDDFYGNPWPRLEFRDNEFLFHLGGKDRLQIGLSSRNRPLCIGAWVPEKKLAIVRVTPFDDNGTYINIADNDQPKGVYSACDQYSIFNGGELNFFELETIAPMIVEEGKVTGSRLVSKSFFFQGEKENVFRLLNRKFGVRLD